MHTLRKGFLSVILFLFSTIAFADFTYPVLVLDADNTATLPTLFRTAATPLPPNTTVSTAGLATLPMMGSAQFSEKQLLQVVQKIHPTSLMVFDLRQESHGFLNGAAISWYGINNQENAGKTPQQVEQTQFQYLSSLQNSPRVTVQQIIKKSGDGKILQTVPVTFNVSNVFAEADLMRAYNFGYTRIYVTDSKRPDDTQVDAFLKTIQSLPGPTWVYFHCRGGLGRTTTFMAMLDMMHNAQTVSFNDIIARQALIGGEDLSKLPPQTDMNYTSQFDRFSFLQDFYNYCKTSQFKTP